MLSVRKRHFLGEFIVGIILFCTGILGMTIDEKFIILDIILCLIMIITAVFIFFKMKKRQVENDDELSLANHSRATERMVNIMIIVILLLSIVISLLEVTIIFTTDLLFMFLGAFQIGVFLIFIHLETEE